MSIEVFQPCLFLSLPLSPDVETSGKEITTCFSVLVTDFRPLNTLLNPSSISLSLPPPPPLSLFDEIMYVHSKWQSSARYSLLRSHYAQVLLCMAEGTAMKQVQILTPQEDVAEGKIKKKKKKLQ